MTLGRADIEALVPHKHAMCLWDEVLDWDAQRIVLRTAGHRDAAHPLRSDGQLRALHLCEYGAQAMAVHGGLLALAWGWIGGVTLEGRMLEVIARRVPSARAVLPFALGTGGFGLALMVGSILLLGLGAGAVITTRRKA